MSTRKPISWMMEEVVGIGLINTVGVEGPDGTYYVHFTGLPPELSWDDEGDLHVEATHELWQIRRPDGSVWEPKTSAAGECVECGDEIDDLDEMVESGDFRFCSGDCFEAFFEGDASEPAR